MKVTITGATGLIGRKVIAELTARGDEVTVLSRSPANVPARVGYPVRAVAWDPSAGPAPGEALDGQDAVVHLAGEPVAQRWTPEAKRRIRESRELGTGNLVAGIRACTTRPVTLVSASAVGFYGSRGDEQLDETASPDGSFLSQVCEAWEREALEARQFGLRVACLRVGVVLDRDGGALERMLPPFRFGVGGPIAGGRQYLAWVHADDIAGMVVAALDGEGWSGPINATAPEPVTNAAFSRALGKALHRPAIAPVPALAVRLLFGEMSQIITGGQRAVPARAAELGYRFRHPRLDDALRAAVS